MRKIFAILAAAAISSCEAPAPPAPCPPQRACPSASPSIVYVDLEAERMRRDYDPKTGKKTAKAYCGGWGAHWAALGQVAWCEAKAAEFDCGYDSWMDAWPGGHPWSAEGNFHSIGACCFDDPESRFECGYMKERARVCDELLGQTHKVRCHTVFCEDKRKVCL